MKRTWIVWGLAALTFYLFALILTLPAQHIVAWSGAPLAEVQGTLWRGSATLVWQGESLRNVRWHLYPLWPWQGALGATLHIDDQGWQAEGQLRFGWNGRLMLRDALLTGPLDAPLLTRHLPLPLGGQARLAIPRATWHEGLRQAEGVTLEVFKPKLNLGEPLILGDLAVELEVNEGRLEGRLFDKGGPLELHGRIQGDAAHGLALDARIQARPSAPAHLVDTLRLLPPAPDGGVQLSTRRSAPWLAAPR